MSKHDYRTKALKGYVYSPDTQSGDAEICPKCNQWFIHLLSKLATCLMGAMTMVYVLTAAHFLSYKLYLRTTLMLKFVLLKNLKKRLVKI